MSSEAKLQPKPEKEDIHLGAMISQYRCERL